MPGRLRIMLFFFVFLAACAAGEITPVPIESGDMCSFCRMAISEKRFAAEIIMEDEKVMKFDDIGCMLRFRKAPENQSNVAAIFVMDHDSQQWIKAENGFYVKSPAIKTPMSSGIVAFGDKPKAEKRAADSGARVWQFSELQDGEAHAK